MARWHLIVDVDRCHGCNNCMLACKDEHVGNDWPGYTAPQPLHGHRWIDVLRKDRGQYPQVDVAFRPTPCMHCDDAPCVERSGGAIHKREDGIVLIDPEKAKGRPELVDTCPYGVIKWNDELAVGQKCTLCAHLLDEGWTQTRCSQACPTDALELVKLTDGEIAARAGRDGLEPLRPELDTRPTTLYRNLGRFHACFIAGSVAYEHDGVTDCAQGAQVVLRQDGRTLREARSDAFGDFRFDGLAPESGRYEVAVSLAGHGEAIAQGELGESLTLDTILLERSPAGG